MNTTVPPPRFYKPNDRVHVQAEQLWPILVAVAESQAQSLANITYQHLAMRMGLKTDHAAHRLYKALSIVNRYCLFNNEPPLNVVVVNPLTGLPGADFVLPLRKTTEMVRAEVLEQRWFKMRAPSSGTFRKVWDAMGSLQPIEVDHEQSV